MLGLARAPPKVAHTERNTKKMLERQLKRACESLIHVLAGRVADPIVSWVRKADALAHAPGRSPGGGGRGGKVGVQSHAFASADKMKELMASLRASVKDLTHRLVGKVALYLPNEQTRKVLLTPIKANILEAYARLHVYLLAEFEPDEYLAFGAITPGLACLLACLPAPPAPLPHHLHTAMHGFTQRLRT